MKYEESHRTVVSTFFNKVSRTLTIKYVSLFHDNMKAAVGFGGDYVFFVESFTTFVVYFLSANWIARERLTESIEN